MSIQSINRLNLSSTNVTDIGLKDLAKLKTLVYIDLRHCEVTESGVEELKRALPECQIQSDRIRSNED